MAPLELLAARRQKTLFLDMHLGPSSESGKIVAIVQSCYIPWKGYFDLINLVDEFILYDDRQYTRRDWRNRNRIKTPQGSQWLTIPVVVKGRYDQRIDETRISDPGWADRHWKTLVHNYASAPHFDDYRDTLESLYRTTTNPRLSVVNRTFLEAISEILGIRTRLSWSTDYGVEGLKTKRLINLCRAAGATSYLSGPSAREYMEEGLFEEAGIALEYMDYGGYPEYPQLHPPFDHAVTVLDLIFNTGAEAPRYMKSLATRKAPV
jgi:WbqC-like protein family